MKINLVYNKNIPNYHESLNKIEKALIDFKMDFKTFSLDDMECYGDFAFVIGGDGTILRAAKFYSAYSVPVLGINLGRLGFLSQVNLDNVNYLLEQINTKKYYTEKRLMLSSDNYLALNDFVIKGCNPKRASKFYLEINDELVCDYVADGLIISTPTGSTAYCLSAGGPVLHPLSNSIVIVPICPHTLNARPLVVPASEKISVKTSENLLAVSIDGYDTMECTDKITITASKREAILAFLSNSNYYSILRDKLHWGFPAGE